MRKDARKIQVSYKIKPEILNMIEWLISEESPLCGEGWNRTDIVEQAIKEFYWSWREQSGNSPK